MAFPRKDRVKPTHYPHIPFHAIRCTQLVSSIIVGGIMSYFLWQLKHDHYRLPWTFILLLAVSLLTVLSLTATIVLHCFYGLNPLLNSILNGSLLLLWSVSFGLLSWWSSGTLSHFCNRANWDDEIGVSICRTYKALFSFALFGVVSTLLAVILDAHVQRGVTKRGKFAQLGVVDNKREFEAGDFEIGGAGFGAGDRDVNPNPMARDTRQRGAKGNKMGYGYEVVGGEASYAEEDTAYQGAAGQVERRSLEDRM